MPDTDSNAGAPRDSSSSSEVHPQVPLEATDAPAALSSSLNTVVPGAAPVTLGASRPGESSIQLGGPGQQLGSAAQHRGPMEQPTSSPIDSGDPSQQQQPASQPDGLNNSGYVGTRGNHSHNPDSDSTPREHGGTSPSPADGPEPFSAPDGTRIHLDRYTPLVINTFQPILEGELETFRRRLITMMHLRLGYEMARDHIRGPFIVNKDWLMEYHPIEAPSVAHCIAIKGAATDPSIWISVQTNLPIDISACRPIDVGAAARAHPDLLTLTERILASF
jgi:hypothetical protein